jgi:chromosome segregation ATPase
MGDFYKEKHELTSNLTSKDDAVLVLEEEIENLTARKDEIQEQMDGLYGVIDQLKQSNVELNAHYNNVCNERDHLRSTIEELKGKMAKLEYYTDNEIQMAELSVEAEKLVHENAVEDLKSEFNLELKRQQIQAKELKNEVKQLERTNSEQGLMISRLKTAVRESLEEALRLGSKLTSEQAKLLELTNTVYSFEEENFKLKESLSQVQYDGLEIVELEQLQIIMSEKQTLQKELFDKETILVRTMNTLTHFQLKLAKAEQERDDQSEVAGAEIKRLQTELLSLEKHQHEKVQDLTMRLAQVEQERKLQSEAADVEMTRLKDDLSSLMSHSEAADAEVRRLKIHLSSLTDRERYEGVLMQLVRAEQEQIEQSECAKAEIKRLQTEVSSLKMFQQEREQDIMTRQAQTEQEQASQLETANAEIKYLKGELSSSTKLHNEKEQSFMELARVEQSDIANAVIQQLKKRSEIASAEINRLQTELSSLKMSQQEKEQDLMTRLAQTEQEREMQMETADAEITRLKNELTAVRENCSINANNHLYEELLSKLETNEGYYESRVRSLTMTITSMEEDIKSLTDENDRLSHINKDMLEERNQELNAKQQIVSDSSTIRSSSSNSKADYLNRTASEVEATIAAIKIHHSNTVQKLQSDLDDARARLNKYQRKVKDLTLLVNEGSVVVESLHNRLRLEKSRKDRNSTKASQDVCSRDDAAAAWSAALARDSSEESSCPTTSSVASSDGMTTDSLVSADQDHQPRQLLTPLPRAADRESVLPRQQILSRDSEGGESLVSD